jgi:mRNA-degrading endonuclease RelE of RelBE toxin-antitoxin system
MKSKKEKEKEGASKPSCKSSKTIEYIEYTDTFERSAKKLSKKYRSFFADLSNFSTNILKDPMQGTPLGNDCYKIRLAISSKGRGKSGGARIITYLYYKGKTIYLLDIYDKSDIDNISDQYIQSLIDSIKSEFE